MITTLKRYRAFASMRFYEPFQENLLFLFWQAGGIISFAVMATVWRTAYAHRPSVAGMTVDQTLRYLLGGTLFSGLLIPNAFFAHDMWSGNIAVRFLRPVTVFGQYVAEMAGRLVLNKVLNLPLTIPLAWLLDIGFAPSGNAGVLALSLACSASLGFAVEMIVGACMTWFDQNAWAADWLRGIILGALSGAWLPLAFLPGGLGRALGWLPFASMVSAPLRIYIGTGGIDLVLRQLMWTLVCWPLALWLWRRNRQRLVLHGG